LFFVRNQTSLTEVMKTMFAIVRTGGKQYRVAPGDKIVVEKLAGEAGETVTLDDVLFASEGAVKGLSVSAEIIAQAKAEKVIVFKKRRRHNYRRKAGHRQQHTILKITAVGSEKAPAAAKKEAAPKADAAPKAAKAEAAPAIDASNLSLISGVGPTIEKKLRAAGITSWNDIAAWDEAAIEKWDAELKLGGRATKEEWVDQAKELLAGKEPRAKTDKAEKASGKDK
jgi:large subunit ribosomal protein L21